MAETDQGVREAFRGIRIVGQEGDAIDPERLEPLIRAIRSGTCVAFLGAGFSAAAGIPTWAELLALIAVQPGVSSAIREHVLPRLEKNRADWNEEAAQLLREDLGEERFQKALQRELNGRTSKTMQTRLSLLRGIPFKAVLTTNFDDVLDGRVADREIFRAIVQSGGVEQSAVHWTELWSREVPVVKLHGDLARREEVVFSRTDYRRRLYDNPYYLGLLRSILLQNTVLYLGFSFTDPYLNELRSETLAMLGYEGDHLPVAYALMNDVPAPSRRHFRKAEGVEILSYHTRQLPDGSTDFSGFEQILREIHNHTNPRWQLGSLLQGKRILWVDPFPESVGPAKDYLDEAIEVVGGDAHTIQHVDSAARALAALKDADLGKGYDLVISHYGEHLRTAELLLSGIRIMGIEVPVLVFAGPWDVEVRKPRVMRWGAVGYYHSFEGLVRAIEHVFSTDEQPYL
jgi:PAS domain-containing protein